MNDEIKGQMEGNEEAPKREEQVDQEGEEKKPEGEEQTQKEEEKP